jgi:hypothetical protein
MLLSGNDLLGEKKKKNETTKARRGIFLPIFILSSLFS